MRAQAHGVGGVALPGEIGQKVVFPAPRAMPGAVQEQDRCRVCHRFGNVGDQFQPHIPPLSYPVVLGLDLTPFRFAQFPLSM